jgi:hypothetical protein
VTDASSGMTAWSAVLIHTILLESLWSIYLLSRCVVVDRQWINFFLEFVSIRLNKAGGQVAVL